MEIILLQDIDKVGNKYEIVTVKNGFGRNFLIPKGMAIIANDTNRSRLDDHKQKEEDDRLKRVAEFQQTADKLEGKVLRIGAKAGTSGKIFGSVTNIQIAAALKEQFDVEIERRLIDLPEEVKDLGTYSVTLRLHPEVNPEVKFEVVAE